MSAARADRLKAAWRGPLPALVQINGEPKPPHRINLMPAGDALLATLYADAIAKAYIDTGRWDTGRGRQRST